MVLMVYNQDEHVFFYDNYHWEGYWKKALVVPLMRFDSLLDWGTYPIMAFMCVCAKSPLSRMQKVSVSTQTYPDRPDCTVHHLHVCLLWMPGPALCTTFPKKKIRSSFCTMVHIAAQLSEFCAFAVVHRSNNPLPPSLSQALIFHYTMLHYMNLVK